MNIKDEVLRELSTICAVMTSKNLNELIDATCKVLIKHNNFNNLSIEELTYFYQTIADGYCKGIAAAMAYKLNYANKSINDPSKLVKAFHDLEFMKFVKDMYSDKK